MFSDPCFPFPDPGLARSAKERTLSSAYDQNHGGRKGETENPFADNTANVTGGFAGILWKPGLIWAFLSLFENELALKGAGINKAVLCARLRMKKRSSLH
jgi:hypothetical protein